MPVTSVPIKFPCTVYNHVIVESDADRVRGNNVAGPFGLAADQRARYPIVEDNP